MTGRQQGIPELHGGEPAAKASRRGGTPVTFTELEECRSGLAGLLRHHEPALLRRPFAAAQRGRSRLPPLRTTIPPGMLAWGHEQGAGRLPERLRKTFQRKKTSLRNHIVDSQRVGKLKLL